MSTRTKKRLVEAKRKRASAQGSIYVGRNDLCPCGSGKKAKHCCLAKIEALEALPPTIREQIVAAKILGHFGEPSEPVPDAVAEKFAAVAAASGNTGPTMSAPEQVGFQGRPAPAVVPPGDGPCGDYDFSCNGVQGK